MSCLPFCANSGQYFDTGASRSSSPCSMRRFMQTDAKPLVTEYTLTIVSRFHGRVRSSSAQPPHSAITGSPSISTATPAPISPLSKLRSKRHALSRTSRRRTVHGCGHLCPPKRAARYGCSLKPGDLRAGRVLSERKTDVEPAVRALVLSVQSLIRAGIHDARAARWPLLLRAPTRARGTPRKPGEHCQYDDPEERSDRRESLATGRTKCRCERGREDHCKKDACERSPVVDEGTNDFSHAGRYPLRSPRGLAGLRSRHAPTSHPSPVGSGPPLRRISASTGIARQNGWNLKRMLRASCTTGDTSRRAHRQTRWPRR